MITDGHDTSSTIERDQAFAITAKNNIQVYAMGVGEVFNEDALKKRVLASGGNYYPARELAKLPEQLTTIVSDLRGQYKLSYITLRRQGNYKIRLDLTLQGAGGTKEIKGSWVSPKIDVGKINGYDNIGRISVDPPTIDATLRTAAMFMRALHIPRAISHFRFRLNTDKPVQGKILPQDQGGLLEGWILSGPDEEGFYDVSSQQPLDFGNFGLLFQFDVSEVTEQQFEMPVEFDNSLYGEGECGSERKCLIYLPQGPSGVFGSIGVSGVIKLGNPKDSTAEFLGFELEPIDDITWQVTELVSAAAEQAGLKPGDWFDLRDMVITLNDGERLVGEILELGVVIAFLQTGRATEVTLKVHRDTDELRVFKLTP